MKGYTISLAITLYIMEGTFDQYKKNMNKIFVILNLCFFEFDIKFDINLLSYVLSVGYCSRVNILSIVSSIH